MALGFRVYIWLMAFRLRVYGFGDKDLGVEVYGGVN